MKKINLILTLTCSLLLSVAYAKTSGQPLDQMVAIVNDELITRTELDHGVKAAKMQIISQVDTNLSDKDLEQQVLQQLINKKLQLQTATQAGLKISDQEVNDVITRIAKQNNVPVNELFQHVRQAGMSDEEYKTEIHDQIIVQRLQQHEVAGKVTVTPEEINAYMKNAVTPNVPVGPSEYRVNDLLIPVSENPSTDEINAAKLRAIEIKTKIQNGADVVKLTQEESKKAVALQGNDLGWRKVDDMPSAFTEHVAKMKKNEVAGPIQTGNGFHVLHMADTRKTGGAEQQPNDRKTVEAMLMQKKFEVAIRSWMSRLRSAAFISTTA